MSSIGPDPRLNATGLDRLGTQVSLDDLRRQQGAQDGVQDSAAAIAPEAQGAATDSGEDVLNAAAWDDVAPGDRLLAGDLGLEGQLGALDLAQAADYAADAVLDAFV